MTNITKFTHSNLPNLRSELDAAINTVLAKHGLSANFGRFSFDDSTFTTKLTVNCGSNDDAALREFKKYAFRFDLTGDEFGKSFTHSQDTYTIVGLKPKSRKYPILAKNKAGKTYKFPAAKARAAA